MKSNKQRTKIDQSEYIALNDHMRTVCTSSIGGDGAKIATYAEPWTDEAVAKKMREKIPHITEAHVSNFRLRIFGALVRTKGDTTNQHTLSRRIDHLEKWAASLDLGFTPAFTPKTEKPQGELDV